MPQEVISSDLLNSFLFYVSILGVLLFIGVISRIKVGIFKKLFIPASLIAGFIGIIIGPYGLKILPEPMVSTWGSLAGILITIVFAPMLIGMTQKTSKEAAKHAVPQVLYSYLGSTLQIGVPLLVTGLILIPLWNVDELFGSIIEIGWAGGHGTAGGMQSVFESFNWMEGTSLSLTSATIGLLVGIIGGMIIINIGVKKGYTSVIKSTSQLKSQQQDIPQEKKANSYNTINADVVESFGFHFALIFIAVLIGWGLQQLISPFITGVPLFPLAMIGGLVVNIILSKTKFYELIDKNTLNRIQGLALEFLIVGAVASIKIPVVLEFAVPLLIITAFSIITLLWYFYFIGPKMFKKDWFEHSIVNYGTATGVTAVGLMLLRTVDPNMKTEAASAYAIRAPFYSPFLGGGLITSIVPVLIINYGTTLVGFGFLLVSILILVVSKLLGILNWEAGKNLGNQDSTFPKVDL
ncbi:ESS family glutamate:Na+ symporter [Bacillus pakistanensis]|uniref:ESS family glutamate:Na+ symporter n=1 Tax=Rossellomorea pakistanensis TaxID=992288 RepID=A0ABS2NHI6_9BACI|nr:sodium/glutamate symporter [Bacillus pakistanensis]MBM7587307.1 ESS family glutamate:Na+ symporter [Bacillus pakistanensis]